MNFMKRFISAWKGTRSGTYNPAQWLIDWVHGGAPTSSGLNINEESALKYCPFWASVRVISGTLASLPFIVYRRVDGGKERVSEHRVYNLIHNRPNEYMDALTFIETRQSHVLTYGNGYAEIQRDGGGRPIALWPLLPDRTFRKISDNGIPYYEIHQIKGGTVYLPDYNVLHIKGLGFDGYTGYNVVSYHKEAIGYGVAVKEYGSRFFGNGANPGGVLEHPETLSKPAADRLKESWNKAAGGLTKAHRTQVLEEGMKWKPMGVEPEKAQALEVQKYTVDDCSRIFNIPPHKIGSLERATFSNIEEQNIDFVTQTMFYWFRKWEQECNYKLFMPSEKKNTFCEILVDGLLRGNIKSRYEAYRIGRSSGFLSVNDVREKENMNSIGEIGDIYLEPLNMKPAGTETPTKPEQDVSRAHYGLIKSGWLRIIPKQKNKDVDYTKLQKHAFTILSDSVIAYASIRGVPEEDVLKILNDVITSHVKKETILQDEDATRLTKEIIERIGDNYVTT